MTETSLSEAVVECRSAVSILTGMRQAVIEARQKADALQREYEAQSSVVNQAWDKLTDLAIGYERGE